MNLWKRIPSLIKRPKFIEILIGIACTSVFISANFFHVPLISSFIQQLDGQIYDHMLKLNIRQIQPASKVVIVDIDNPSVEKEGRWPWPRDKMAALLKKLKQDGVVSIGMDIVMSEAEINYAHGLKDKLRGKPEFNDKALLNHLKKLAPEVDNDTLFAKELLDQQSILGFLFHNEQNITKGSLPKPLVWSTSEPVDSDKLPFLQFQGFNGSLDLFIKSGEQAGFVTNLPDEDGTVRHAILIAANKDKFYPSLALKTAMNFLLVDKVTLMTDNNQLYGIDLDGTFIPTNRHGQILIPYWGYAGFLPYFSATDVLNDKVPKDELNGAVAIIGSTMTLLSDLHNAPVADIFPGVEIVGSIVQGILDQVIATEFDWQTWEGAIYLTLIGLILALLLPFLGVVGKFILLIIGLITILATTTALFAYESIYIPSALLLLLTGVQTIINYSYAYMVERRQKKQISQLFGQYVPTDYVKELIESPDQYSMEGQTRQMTALFADIRSFTTISEQLDASGVKRLLNTFFTPITEIIFKHRGTIDKYVGDMIVAFWGAPMIDEEHSKHAVEAAIEIFANLERINERMSENNLPKVSIGLGLATGLMNVGDMGSEFRRAYTVLGDTVNLASRLQDLTKFYQVDILTNDTTCLENPDYLWKAMDKVAVKGRNAALTIYTPLGLKSSMPAELVAEVDAYHAALECYYKQDWEHAAQRFETLHHDHPEVYVYELYLERIAEFQKEPPPADWDGVYIHTHK